MNASISPPYQLVLCIVGLVVIAVGCAIVIYEDLTTKKA